MNVISILTVGRTSGFIKFQYSRNQNFSTEVDIYLSMNWIY